MRKIIAARFPAPKFRPISLEPYRCVSGEALEKDLSKELSDYVQAVNYDKLTYLTQFLALCGQMRGFAIFNRMESSGQRGIDTYGGSDCVGQAIDLSNQLRQKNYPAVVAAQKADHEFRYTHAAVVINFKADDQKQGCILLDPGNNFVKAHLLYPNIDTEFKHMENTLNYLFLPDQETIRVTLRQPQKPADVSIFLLREAIGADQFISNPNVVLMKGHPVSSRDQEGNVVASINPMFGTKQIKFRYKKEELYVSFADFKNKTVPPGKLRDAIFNEDLSGFTEEFEGSFGPKAKVWNRLNQAIENEETMKDLYSAY